MIKAIAFDLDDTLLNTSEILIPSAVKRIYELILKNGYKKSFTEFNRERLDFVHHSSHREFFKQVVANDPQLSPKDSLLETVVKYFYQPEIPQNLSLIPGAKENLELLNTKYKLYLVTSGVIPTQELKIKALSLEQWIQKTNHLIIDGSRFKSKKEAFKFILEAENIHPSELLSCGNRLSQEIRMAKEIGAFTCYFQFGEHAHDIPKDNFEKADFTIQHQKELISTCRL